MGITIAVTNTSVTHVCFPHLCEETQVTRARAHKTFFSEVREKLNLHSYDSWEDWIKKLHTVTYRPRFQRSGLGSTNDAAVFDITSANSAKKKKFADSGSSLRKCMPVARHPNGVNDFLRLLARGNVAVAIAIFENAATRPRDILRVR